MTVEEINVGTLRKYIEDTTHDKRVSQTMFQNFKWEPATPDANFYSPNPDVVREYTRLLIESEWIGCLHFCPDKFMPSEMLKTLKEEDRRPMNRDRDRAATKKVFKDNTLSNAMFCMGSWLSVDDKPWADKYPLSKKLNTGLVLQYPEFVIPFCAYFSGLKRYPYKNMLLVDPIRTYIDEFTEKHMSSLGLGRAD